VWPVPPRHRAAAGHPERHLAQAADCSAHGGIREPQHLDEDPVALTGVRVSVNLRVGYASARAVVSGEALALSAHSSGAVEFTVPRTPINELVCIELG
jgi:hypothetical protein